MASCILVNGVSSGEVSALDRGLAYGDGLFESIRFVSGVSPLWSRHMQRLTESCERLRLPMANVAQLWDEALHVSRSLAQSVVRISLTRGVGERGYAPSMSPQPTRIVAAFAAPAVSGELYAKGVRVRLCDIRLAEQPMLAGMKHLNRLEQVLARAEWNDSSISEGVLCDIHGHVISATMANLFAQIDGVLLTPSVDRCGVAGVGRAEVLAMCPQARIGKVTLDALLNADEVFLSSSVRGILPVHSLGERVFAIGAVTRQLQQHWHNLGFSMEQGG